MKMRYRFQRTTACILAAMIGIGSLPQTVAYAIHPSDLAPRLKAPHAPQARDETASAGVVCTSVSLLDPSTGVPAIDTMLPDGWTAQLETDWGIVDTSQPCLATASFASPDGQAAVIIQTGRNFLESRTSDGFNLHYEGADLETYLTYLNYRDAGGVLDMYFDGILGTGGVIIQETPVDETLQSVLDDVAKTLMEGMVSELQANIGSYGQAVQANGYEGTASVRRYRFTMDDGNSYVADACCCCIAYEYSIDSGFMVSITRPWFIPAVMFYIAPDEATLEKYEMEANVILNNSRERNEFAYVKHAFGSDIRNMVMRRQTQQISSMTEAQAQTYLDDYDPSDLDPGYTSDAWANDWSEFIYDQQGYTTLDGGTIKVGTEYDAVYQNGDQFYLGTVGGAPDGWTRLTEN